MAKWKSVDKRRTVKQRTFFWFCYRHNLLLSFFVITAKSVIIFMLYYRVGIHFNVSGRVFKFSNKGDHPHWLVSNKRTGGHRVRGRGQLAILEGLVCPHIAKTLLENPGNPYTAAWYTH